MAMNFSLAGVWLSKVALASSYLRAALLISDRYLRVLSIKVVPQG